MVGKKNCGAQPPPAALSTLQIRGDGAYVPFDNILTAARPENLKTQPGAAALHKSNKLHSPDLLTDPHYKLNIHRDNQGWFFDNLLDLIVESNSHCLLVSFSLRIRS